MSKNSNENTSFIDLVLRGRALPEEIDDYVDSWHAARPEDKPAKLELHTYLGMTWEEYRLWVETPMSLRFIVSAHDSGLPVTRVIQTAALAPLAARSADRTSAQRVYQWLLKTGRLEEP